MNLNQVKIYFFVRRSTVKGKRGCLNIRITVNNKQFLCTVKALAMYPEEFDVKTQNPRKKCDMYFECKDFMINIQKEIYRIHAEHEKKRHVFTKEHMQRAVEDVYHKIKHGYESEAKTYLQVYDEYLAEQKKSIGLSISVGTYHVRRRYKKPIEEILRELKLHTEPICNLSEKNVEDMSFHLQKRYSLGTAARILPVFSSVFKHSLKKHEIYEDPCKMVRAVKFSKTTKLLWLENEEVHKIMNLDLHGEASKYRDAFIFCCFTGLSIGDYMLLNPNTRERLVKAAQSPKNIQPGRIVETSKGSFLVGNRRKTGTSYRVPILPEVDALIKSYGTVDNLPFNLIRTSNMLNMFMKLASIDKSVTFHTARKTMANYLLNVRMMNPFLVKEIMGWKKIEESEPYTVVSMDTLAHSLL